MSEYTAILDRFRDGDPGVAAMIDASLSLTAEQRARLHRIVACSYCSEHPPGTFAPSHDGSPLCKSGSIASGGTRDHCTCDTCF